MRPSIRNLVLARNRGISKLARPQSNRRGPHVKRRELCVSEHVRRVYGVAHFVRTELAFAKQTVARVRCVCNADACMYRTPALEVARNFVLLDSRIPDVGGFQEFQDIRERYRKKFPRKSEYLDGARVLPRN